MLLALLLAISPATNPGQIGFTQDKTQASRRPLADKLADIVSVKDAPFNAKGDGVTDDTAAVAAAYAAVVAAGGGTLYFPRGTYLFNLTISVIGVSVSGESTFGTIFKPKDLTKPVIQVGDGTASVQQNEFSKFEMEGDNSTATSDGLVQLGARYVSVHDVVIAHFGGDNIRITSSATQASTYSRYSHVQSANPKGAALKLVYGPLFTTAIDFVNCGIEQSNTGTNSWGGYFDGVTVWFANTWFELANNHGIYMSYDSNTRTVPPKLYGSNSTFAESAASSDTLVSFDTTGTAVTHTPSTTYLDGMGIFGKITWTDATSVSLQVGGFQRRLNGVELIGQVAFNGHLNDSRDEQSAPTTRILQGGGGAGAEYIDLAGAGFRVPGTAGKALIFANNGHLWRSANGMLRYIPSGTPASDTVGISITPHKQAISHSGTGSLTIDVTLGSWAYVTVTDNNNFTINAPSSGGAPLANLADQRLTLTIGNTSGGALGTITFNGTFHMAAFTAPGNTLNTTIEFMYDGSNWLQVSTQGPAVAN